MSEPPIQQSQIVQDVHNIPRFGHSSRISKLASPNRNDQEDYIRGILSFCAFLIVAFYLWMLVLIMLKFVWRDAKVGCSAGGKTLDMAQLRKDRVPRAERRNRIIRSWRVQWAFLTASVLIPITTLLMTRNGLTPLIASLDEVESINDNVEAFAFRGVAIAESLQQEIRKLHTNFTLQDFDFRSKCPNSNNQRQQSNASQVQTLPIARLGDYIQVGIGEIDQFIHKHATDAHATLSNIVRVTQRVDNSIEWSYANDWALKFFLLVFNVVNGFFLFGAFLSRQNIVSFSYRRFLSYAMIPVFTFLLMCCLILTCVFGSAAMLNADFCYGNRQMEGTLFEILQERGFDETASNYQALLHYMGGCLGEDPLQFVHSFDSLVKHTRDAVDLLEVSLTLKNDCADDVSDLVLQLPYLATILGAVADQVTATIDLSSCHQVSPILRRILRGATCKVTVEGVVWIFGCMCTLTILGFVMLTVRAGLFNSIVRAPRRRRRREREKEFAEYQAYMAEYYEETDAWIMDPTLKKEDVAKLPGIPHNPTFETEEASLGEESDFGDKSDVACFASPKSKSSSSPSSASSYESDYSEDSEEDQQSLMSQSILSRLLHNFSNSRQQHEDSQSSFMLGLGHLDTLSSSQSSVLGRRSNMTILDLQTPRRRKQQSLPNHGLPAPYDNRNSMNDSPESSVGSIYTSSPPLRSRKPTPKAPTKPKRLIYRTRAGSKES